MSPLGFGLGSSRAFGIGKSVSVLKTVLYAYIKNISGSNVIYDGVTNATATVTNLTSSNITTGITKFNPGSIDFPYTSPLISFSLPTINSTELITIEFWKYIDTNPGSFDILVELNRNASQYVLFEYPSGSMRTSSSATSGAGWTNILNVWRHYAICINYNTGMVYRALDGVRSTPFNYSSNIIGYAPTSIRFKDSIYGGWANGYMDELRVNVGDVYNLINNATYTVPTQAMGLWYQ